MEGLARPFGPVILRTQLCLWPPEQVASGLPGPANRVVACTPSPAPFRVRLELSAAPHTCALPTVDRESGRLAGQGVPAGRPRQARVPRGQQHAAPLALPRAEVLLPRVRQPAHRGALQHHPRWLPATRLPGRAVPSSVGISTVVGGACPCPLSFTSLSGLAPWALPSARPVARSWSDTWAGRASGQRLLPAVGSLARPAVPV